MRIAHRKARVSAYPEFPLFYFVEAIVRLRIPSSVPRMQVGRITSNRAIALVWGIGSKGKPYLITMEKATENAMTLTMVATADLIG